MGSQSKPDARQKNLDDFADYIREMTAPGLGHERRVSTASPRDSQAPSVATDSEAMRFFSESNMR